MAGFSNFNNFGGGNQSFMQPLIRGGMGGRPVSTGYPGTNPAQTTQGSFSLPSGNGQSNIAMPSTQFRPMPSLGQNSTNTIPYQAISNYNNNIIDRAPSQFSNFDQIKQLYGADPTKLLGAAPGTYLGSTPDALLNNINQNRSALGSNYLNNNGKGAAGTFSPVVTGQNFQSQASPLSSLMNYLSILGGNRGNNYSY